jgi:hypothetical protein
MIDITDGIVHVLLVAFSIVVLLISLSAYADRKTTRYLFLSLAFGFLAASQVVGLAESWVSSTQLIFIPATGIHLSYFLDFLMLSSFSLALLAKN